MGALADDVAPHPQRGEAVLRAPIRGGFDELGADPAAPVLLVDHQGQDRREAIRLDVVAGGDVDPADHHAVRFGDQDGVLRPRRHVAQPRLGLLGSGGIAELSRQAGDGGGVRHPGGADDHDGFSSSDHQV